MVLTGDILPMEPDPAQRGTLIRGKVRNPFHRQFSLLSVEEVVVNRIVSVSELIAESVPIV